MAVTPRLGTCLRALGPISAHAAVHPLSHCFHILSATGDHEKRLRLHMATLCLCFSVFRPRFALFGPRTCVDRDARESDRHIEPALTLRGCENSRECCLPPFSEKCRVLFSHFVDATPVHFYLLTTKRNESMYRSTKCCHLVWWPQCVHQEEKNRSTA